MGCVFCFMMEQIKHKGRVIALITEPQPLKLAIPQVYQLVDGSSFTAADLRLLDRADSHPAIKEFLEHHSIDVKSKLSYQLGQNGKSLEIEHFPEGPYKQKKEKLRFKDLLENQPPYASIYTTEVTGNRVEDLLAEAVEDFPNSDLGRVLTGSKQSTFSLNEGFSSVPFETIISSYELHLDRKVITHNEGLKQYMLLHPDFL